MLNQIDHMTCVGRGSPPGGLAATGHPGLDELLAGGFARGHLSEIVGAHAPALAEVLVTVLAAATARGEAVALIDPGDQFVPASGASSGLDLSRLMWVRGQGPGHPRDATQAVERALTALELVIDAGGFGMAVLDLSHLSARQLREVSMTPVTGIARLTSLIRRLERGHTVCLLVASEPMARSNEGQVVELRPGSCSVPPVLGAGGRPGPTGHVGNAEPDRAGAPPAVARVWEARVARARRPCNAFVTFRARPDVHGLRPRVS